MKPYSLDLRRRVLDAYRNGEGSQRRLAARFRVSLSFVRNLLRLVHKVGEVRRIITGAGARLMYPPPYSPDLSPIEQCWSKVKTILRARAARTYAALDGAITEALSKITASP